MPKKNEKKEITSVSSGDLPRFCDFSCKYASFGNPDVSGACRKELAVWCRKFNKYNNKNNKCFAFPK